LGIPAAVEVEPEIRRAFETRRVVEAVDQFPLLLLFRLVLERGDLFKELARLRELRLHVLRQLRELILFGSNRGLRGFAVGFPGHGYLAGRRLAMTTRAMSPRTMSGSENANPIFSQPMKSFPSAP